MTLTNGNGGSVNALVHRLVCEAFHGKAPDGKSCVNHKDCVKTNNHHSNLEWVSYKENNIHSLSRGRKYHDFRGSRNPRAVLVEQMVVAMRADRDAGATLKALESKYGVSAKMVSRICMRHAWKHVA